RARNLHQLAREVTRRHDGTLPDDPEALRTLPGVGRYTAGAVACFAYEKPVAAVDTNVRRVLERAFAPDDVWSLAETMMPTRGTTAWKFNQAMMELGALVCTARKPNCPECPVRSDCLTGRSAVRIRNRRSVHPGESPAKRWRFACDLPQDRIRLHRAGELLPPAATACVLAAESPRLPVARCQTHRMSTRI